MPFLLKEKGIMVLETLWFLTCTSALLLGTHLAILKFWNQKIEIVDDSRVSYRLRDL